MGRRLYFTGKMPNRFRPPHALLLALLALAPLSIAVSQGTGEQAKAEAELAAIRTEIERVQSQVARDAAEKDRLARELRTAEKAVARARAALSQLQRERRDGAENRRALASERQQVERQLRAERAALSGQLRAAYMIGREEPLKLLLNQRDPARAGRMFAYYGYFGRARGEQIARIQQGVVRLTELEDQLALEDQRLAELEKSQQQEVDKLEQARGERRTVLASLQNEARDRTRMLARLRQQRGALEKLLGDLRRAASRFPVDSRSPFGRLRGKLTWPAEGRVIARYGQARAGAIRWGGILMGTQRGAPVHAVYHGRVLYADWLAGLGLLVIVDHGDGYMSLYAHNDQIYRKVGERVTAGDVIAASGDSGGRANPELYFEIRRNGRPTDPAPWFKPN
jgi:septal ring factor EnvC (AmiA/AmiB activator)